MIGFLSTLARLGIGACMVGGVSFGASDLVVSNYILVSSTRVTRTVFEYAFQADVTNNSNVDAVNVKTIINIKAAAPTTVGDNRLSFGDVPAGLTVRSKDTFTVRQDRTLPLDPSSLVPNTFEGPPKDPAKPPAVVQLTNTPNPGANFVPSWSPDGSMIVYICVSPVVLEHEVCTMSFDGSNKVQVTHEAAFGRFVGGPPQWSPDGSRILYSSYIVPRQSHIFTILPTGAKRTQLTFGAVDDFIEKGAWSPDGSQLLFTRRLSDIQNIYSINANGTNERKLTNQVDFFQSASLASWSSDGSLILFSVGDIVHSGGGSQIYTMAPNGSAQRCLTCSRAPAGRLKAHFNRYTLDRPQFNRIAFFEESLSPNANPPGEFFVMEENGTNVKSLDKIFITLIFDFDWQLNDDFIVYMNRSIGENLSLSVVNAYGVTSPSRLTPPLRAEYPMWSPDGSLISFLTTTSVGTIDIWTVGAP